MKELSHYVSRGEDFKKKKRGKYDMQETKPSGFVFTLFTFLFFLFSLLLILPVFPRHIHIINITVILVRGNI